MDKKSAMQIVSKRKVVATPGKFTARVIGNPQYFDGTRPGKDPVPARYIFGTDLISNDQLESLKKNIQTAVDAEKAGAEDTDWTEVIRNSNLSGSLLMGLDDKAPEWMPTKGEIVEVYVDLVNGPNGDTDNKVLRIQSVNPIKAHSAQTVNLTSLFGEVEAPAPKVGADALQD